MLSLSLGQSEDCLTGGALAIDVCLSVSEFISSEDKEAAEFFVLLPSLCDIPRKHTEHHEVHQGKRHRHKRKVYPEHIEHGIYYPHNK